jgi:hypothetical protein
MNVTSYVIDITVREIEEAIPPTLNYGTGRVEKSGTERKVREALHIVTTDVKMDDAITHAIALLNVEMGRSVP